MRKLILLFILSFCHEISFGQDIKEPLNDYLAKLRASGFTFSQEPDTVITLYKDNLVFSILPTNGNKMKRIIITANNIDEKLSSIYYKEVIELCQRKNGQINKISKVFSYTANNVKFLYYYNRNYNQMISIIERNDI